MFKSQIFFQKFLYPTFFGATTFLDLTFFEQNFFGPNLFLTKTTSMITITTTIIMGFDTIEINLVVVKNRTNVAWTNVTGTVVMIPDNYLSILF